MPRNKSVFGSKTHGMPCHVNKLCLFNIYNILNTIYDKGILYIYFKHTKDWSKNCIRYELTTINNTKRENEKEKVYNFPLKMLFLPIYDRYFSCQFLDWWQTEHFQIASIATSHTFIHIILCHFSSVHHEIENKMHLFCCSSNWLNERQFIYTYLHTI